MEILKSDEYAPESAAIVFRQSRIQMCLLSLLMIFFFGGIPFLLIKFEAPKIFLYLFLCLDMLVIPPFLTTLVGAWRSSNWMMAIENGILFVNLRGFASYKFVVAKSILKIQFNEINSVSSYAFKPSVPTSSESSLNQGVERSLLICFKLPHTEELKKVVHEENNRREEKPFLFGLGTSRSKIGNNHAHLKSEDQLKLIWINSSNSIYIRPSLKKALEELSQYVTVDEPIVRDQSVKNTTGDPVGNNDGENQILDFIQSGDKISAIKLAREIYGFDLVSAKEFVEELESGSA